MKPLPPVPTHLPRLADEEGGALLAVLLVLTVVTATVATLVGVQAVQQRFLLADRHRLQAVYLTESALAYALVQRDASAAPLLEATTQALPPLAEGGTCVYTVAPHGGYYRFTATAEVRGYRHELVALIGADAGPWDDPAVALDEATGALAASGTSRIEGPVLTGAGGFQTVRVRGRGFTGRIEGPIGEVAVAHLRFPLLELQLQRALAPADQRKTSSTAAVVITAHDLPALNEGVLLAVSGPLEIRGPVSLPAGTQFWAGGDLTLRGEVTGEGIVMASGGRVSISGATTGAFQVLARRGLRVRGGARLRYPSVLYVAPPDRGDEEVVLHIEGGSAVDGTVLTAGDDEAGRHETDAQKAAQAAAIKRTRIRVDAEAHVRGAVLSAHTVELHGQVDGTVRAQRFHFYQAPVHYVNVLNDVDINRHARPAPYAFPVFSTRPGTDGTRHTVVHRMERAVPPSPLQKRRPQR